MDISIDSRDLDALVRGDHGDPFSILGLHRLGRRGPVVIRAFLPGARAADAIDPQSGEVVAALRRIHEAGVFEGEVQSAAAPSRYRLRVEDGRRTAEIEDPYRFSTILGAMDVHLLSEGTHLEAYNVLGAHCREIDGVSGVTFAVWAPNARRVSVVGEFNAWDGRRHPMRLRPECGIWELFLPGLGPGSLYKYEIKAPDGVILPLKADPFGRRSEVPPGTASIVADEAPYPWTDDQWLSGRAGRHAREAPIAIYEVHAGSWARVPEEGNRYLTYRELAEKLVPYVKDMGFTHIELLPVTEHPFDGSWGYQPLGLFAPTSRFGEPRDFKAFVDRCHAEGLGVILDWVPGHFPSDSHGLGYFDGTHLYEHADPRRGRHRDWDTVIYNYGRHEVRNFLLSCALFWLEEYHLDGLRVDAVASMLYLDYSRDEGEWIPNEFGGNENLEAISFLKHLNELTYGRHPGIVTMAEESTAWPMVSRPTYVGGLGFGYKWNMGWMHDTLRYISKEPVHRRFHHNDLTFGLLYAFSENFILPLSHDEVVHGKGSMLGKMPGDRWQRFANLKLYYAFQYTHPGKKLLFMGGEFGQEREWDHDRSLDWHLLDDPAHRGVQAAVRDLNLFYRSEPALHARDCEGEGFEWIDANDVDQSVLAYLRKSGEGASAIIVLNFTPVVREGYRLGVPEPGPYAERFNTDAGIYGGSGVGNPASLVAEAMPWHGRPHSLVVTLPPLGAIVLTHEEAGGE